MPYSAHSSVIDRTSDRKSTRLNSSHLVISYAVFCLKKKNKAIAVISHYVCPVHQGPLPALVEEFLEVPCAGWSIVRQNSLMLSTDSVSQLYIERDDCTCQSSEQPVTTLCSSYSPSLNASVFAWTHHAPHTTRWLYYLLHSFRSRYL